jgi:hypothetical protein
MSTAAESEYALPFRMATLVFRRLALPSGKSLDDSEPGPLDLLDLEARHSE